MTDDRAGHGRARPGLWRVVALVIGLSLAVGVGETSAQMWPPSFLPANEQLLQNYSAEFPPLGPSYSSMRPDVFQTRAERLLQEAPGAPETFETLVYMERPDQTADVLRRLIRTRPGEIAWTFGLLERRNVFRTLAAAGREDPLPDLIAEARTRLDGMSLSEVAAVERHLVLLETPGAAPNAARREALLAFIARYPDTPAAREAEVDLITSSTSRRAEWIQPLEDVVARYPGTTAAAMALYEKAFQLSTNLNRPGTNPTGRFLEVFDIVRELESGRYPESDAVRRAPWLAIGLSLRNAELAPEDAARLLDGFTEFACTHFTLPEDGQMAGGINRVVLGQIHDLFAREGRGVAGVEQVIDDLARIDAPRASFLRGAFYVQQLAAEPPVTRPALLARAIDVLSSVADSGGELHARRALASLHYAEGDFAAAREAFAGYLSRYPDTPWSWVAAIRVGQCHELLGDLDAAIDAYREASGRYADVRVARELGFAYAAHAAEAAGRFEEAATDYERALDRWGDPNRTARMESYDSGTYPTAWTYVDVRGLDLELRVTQLRRSLGFSGEGTSLERIRRLLDDGYREDVLADVETFLASYPASPLVSEARRLAHRAILETALELAGPANAPRDTAAAIRSLEALENDLWDDAVGVGTIVRAILLARQGAREQADALMTSALRDWRDNQATSGASGLPADVARDVIEIRTEVFERETGASWRERFGWPQGPEPGVRIVNPDVSVRIGDGVPDRATVYPASVADDLLFMTSGQMEELIDAVDALAEQRTGGPPRVPRELLSFLTAHVSVHPGMIGSIWSFSFPPEVRSVTFTNAARTRAEVGIRTYFTGGALLMEKTPEGWRVTGVGPTYIN